MPKYREMPKRQTFQCAECGRRTHMKYVPRSRLCKSCAAKRRRSVPNVPVAIDQNIVVTKAVEERLRRQSEADIPRTRAHVVGEAAIPLTFLAFWVSCFFLTRILFSDWSGTLWLFVLGWCIAIPYFLYLVIERLLAKPRKERLERVNSRLRELAEERKNGLEEKARFYSSPEWAAIRKQVVEQEGRICAECKKKIVNDDDITVDHKYPRSKYPDLALRRENLRVLCRKCNSKKGASDWPEV